MSFLTGLHGVIATALLCALLFVDEAGVPLPFMPNELLLIVSGLLLASGGLNGFIFFPFCFAALLGGSLTGYSWAKLVGPKQLRRIAERLRAGKTYDRAMGRMTRADSRHIGLTRVIPGIRVYATLVAGAGQVPMRTFMKGNIPAILFWMALLTTLGWAVGVPAEHLLTDVEAEIFNLALSGGVFILLGVAAFRAARRAPLPRRAPSPGPFFGIANRDRYWLAIAVDGGIVAIVVAGFDRIVRSVLNYRGHIIAEGRYDVIIVLAAMALAYIAFSRRSSTGETAGERLFDISYVHHRHRAAPPPSPEGQRRDDAVLSDATPDRH